MSRARARRVIFAIGIILIAGFAIGGTFAQRRSLATYAVARTAVRGDIRRYEALLVKGESRSSAAAALRAAGASIESARGDIVITVLRELPAAEACRSVAGQLHVGVDAHDYIDGWESPPLDTECD